MSLLVSLCLWEILAVCSIRITTESLQILPRIIFLATNLSNVIREESVPKCSTLYIQAFKERPMMRDRPVKGDHLLNAVILQNFSFSFKTINGLGTHADNEPETDSVSMYFRT